MCKSKLSSPSGGRIHTTTFSLFHSFTSVHFLSCSFNARKWYRNPDAALTMCCVNFHLQQAVSASLTREQKYIVDRMVEAHRLYRAQDSSHCRVGHSVETLGINIYIYLSMRNLLYFQKHSNVFHVGLMASCVCLLSCLSGHVQKKGRACPMSCHPTCKGCSSLPGQCQVNWTGTCDL